MTQRDHGSFDDDGWTPEERARIVALSSGQLPPAELKERTVSALRSRGLLVGQTRFSTPLILGLLLAASIVFAAGALVGFAAANRRPEANVPDHAVASTRSVAQLDSADSAARQTRHVVWY
jgi:hypothetical protein